MNGPSRPGWPFIQVNTSASHFIFVSLPHLALVEEFLEGIAPSWFLLLWALLLKK